MMRSELTQGQTKKFLHIFFHDSSSTHDYLVFSQEFNCLRGLGNALFRKEGRVGYYQVIGPQGFGGQLFRTVIVVEHEVRCVDFKTAVVFQESY